MMDAIKEYFLGDRDFVVGLVLYERFGSSQSLKRLLRVGGESPANRETLLYELGKLAEFPPIKSVPVGKRSVRPPLVPKTDVQLRRENSPDAGRCKDEVISKLKIRDQLHATLPFIQSREDRCSAALRILDLSDQIDDDYRRLEHFNTHGILPPAKTEKASTTPNHQTPFELFQRQKTLRTYVSRYERLSKSAKTLKMISRHRETLAKYTLELEQVNLQINESV